MAERRTPPLASAETVRDLTWLLGGAGLLASWFVMDASDSVTQSFYAALDGEQRLCWTDDRERAHCFQTKQAAERFAADRITTDVCIVPVN